MRYFLALWAAPLVLFWGWYFLSLNDMNFGYLFLSRQVHDFAFQMYGNVLGIDPGLIPGLVFRACVFDTLIIAAIWAFRRRRGIMNWWNTRRRWRAVVRRPAAGPALPGE